MKEKQCIMMYGNFLFLMSLVLIFIGITVYHNQQRIRTNQQPSSDRFLNTENDKDAPLGINAIVEKVVYGMHEAAFTPISLQADRNTRYQVWYSNMLRRGVPDVYITPETFDDLYNLLAQYRLSPENVETIIRPIYESSPARSPVSQQQPFRPVCLNY